MVAVDDDEYLKGTKEHCYSLIGGLVLSKGESL